MFTLFLSLRAVGYALLSVGAIFCLIYALMKLTGRLVARKKPAQSDETLENPDDEKNIS